MPNINIKLSKTLSHDEKISLKDDCGKAIECFPGKTENWLMVQIETNPDMYFKGTEGDCAFVEVCVLGNVSESGSEKFTDTMCKALEKYGIPADRVYVRYEGGNLWGWNGSNF